MCVCVHVDTTDFAKISNPSGLRGSTRVPVVGTAVEIVSDTVPPVVCRSTELDWAAALGLVTEELLLSRERRAHCILP